MSDRLPEDPTIESYGAALREFLDAMGIEKTNVLGHHTGACTACEMAASYPDRVNRLIMHGVPVYRDHERDAMLGRFRREPWPIEESGSHLIEPWRRRLEITIGWTNLEAMTRNIIDTLAVRDRQWLGFVAAFTYSMWAKMESVTVPGMILTNTGEDLYLLSRRARKIRPDFTYVELEGGTHDIVDEQPENWANAVATYLRS
jgi:pimeloyl-ACP methyl ester carboxylesterase